MGRQSHSKRQKLGKALEGKASGTERKESDLPERHVSERSRPGYRMCALQERRRGGEARRGRLSKLGKGHEGRGILKRGLRSPRQRLDNLCAKPPEN